MKRIFVAIKIDANPELSGFISSIKTLLCNENIKWINNANIHLTLAFLGDTKEKRIKILDNLLDGICSGFPEFEFTLAGAGVFRNFKDPKVIWIGIRSAEKLNELNKLITEGLKKNGFETGDRQFKPHITMGRVRSSKEIANLKEIIGKFSEIDFQTVRVKELFLYESILMHPEPLYKPLGIYRCQ